MKLGPPLVLALLHKDWYYSDAELHRLRWCRGVPGLNLASSKITDVGLNCLDGLPSLEYLRIHNSGVTGIGLKHLRMCDKIRILELVGNSKLSTLDGIESIRSLEYLELAEVAPRLTEDALQPLGELVNLRDLRLTMRRRHLDCDGLRFIAGLKRVETFVLDTEVDDGVFERISGMTSLIDLSIKSSLISGDGLWCLRDLKALKTLRIYGGPYAGGGLCGIRNLAGLETLSIECGSLSTGAMCEISQLKHLRRLTIHENDGVNRGRQDDGLQWLASMKAVEALELRCYAPDEWIPHIAHIASLRSLVLKGSKVTDRGMESIMCLKRLRSLDVSDTRVTDSGVVCLRALDNLEELNLSNNLAITDGSLPHLRAMKGLRSVGLENTRVSLERRVLSGSAQSGRKE
jgi:internalin A